MQRTFILCLGLALSACGGAGLESHAQLPKLTEALKPYGITPTVAETQVATLAYQAPPTTCPHVLRLVVDNEPDIMHEVDGASYLSIATQAPEDGAPAIEPDRPLAAGQIATLTTYYKGFRAEKMGALRDSFLSATQAGPASPTAGCLAKTWDPIEDAMALGWPEVPGRLTAIGERWTGLRVAGKCNRAACVDPKTGGGGPENHDRTCVTQDWQEQLVGLFEHDGERLALVRGTWNDGHGEVGPANETGIWGIRTTLINLDHGRPMWSRHELQHNFAQPTADKSWAPIHRVWEMSAADACPGSLAAHGWSRPEDVTAMVQKHLAAQADPTVVRTQTKKVPRDGEASRVQPEDAGEPYIVPKPPTTPKE